MLRVKDIDKLDLSRSATVVQNVLKEKLFLLMEKHMDVSVKDFRELPEVKELLIAIRIMEKYIYW